MSSFNMKIKFEDRVIAKAKGNNLDDFDNIMDGLKEKFNGQDSKRRKK